MSTNVYKRFDPRVMEREEHIGINSELPTMKVMMLTTTFNNIPGISWLSILLVEEINHQPVASN
jgi:hypothetical protein